MKKLKSLKTRVLFLLSGLILLVFLLIFAAFNLLISNYIESSATEALARVRSDGIPPDMEEDRVRPEKKYPEIPGGSTERLFVTEDYEVLVPDFYPEVTESSPLYDVKTAVEKREISLEEGGVKRLTAGEGLYYYTVVKSRTMTGMDLYEVHFINMSNLYDFEKNLSQMLLLIMSVALLLTVILGYLLAGRIVKPVKALSVFAKRMGEGEYDSLEEDFSDLELHELKAVMNETSEKLKKYQEDQRTFFQNASHELRTPLQIIKSNAEALEVGLLEKEKALPVMKREVDHLGSLVEDIILLSKLDAKMEDLRKEKLDLRETLSASSERFMSILLEKGLTIRYDFPKEPVYFTYEEKTFERAFENLLSNAVRYAKHEITLSVSRAEGRIFIRVQDDGEGMAEETRKKLFDRFYKGKDGQHGIGLSIVRSVISAYEGRIDVKSGKDGTVFIVILPDPIKSEYL